MTTSPDSIDRNAPPERQSVSQVFLPVSIRQFVSRVCQRGGLSPLLFQNLDAQTGIQLHKAFAQTLQEKYGTDTVQTELGISGEMHTSLGLLPIRGRADAVCWNPAGSFTVIEAKSYSGRLRFLTADSQYTHDAQAMLYAYFLHHQHPDPTRTTLEYSLVYLSAEGEPPQWFHRTISVAEAQKQIQDWAEAYVQFASGERAHLKQRNHSLRNLKFPFALLRNGQKEFMHTVLEAFQTQRPALIEAPTGTGKTLSTLFPALKALSANMGNKIFYLTAKVTTRTVAEEALALLQTETQDLRSITLRAKEQSCLAPECFCDPKVCPYAVQYHDLKRPALQKLLALRQIQPDVLESLAKEFQLCPHELALDYAELADVVIGDYAHFFDPRARLSRFFSEDAPHQLLLFDEAHNLPDRTRAMYSAQLSFQSLHKALQVLTVHHPQTAQALETLRSYFKQLALALKKDEPGFDQVERALAQKPVFSAPNFRAVRSPLPGLRRYLFLQLPRLRDALESIDNIELRRPVLELYFSVLFFLRVHDELWDSSYLTHFIRTQSDLLLQLNCLDPSAQITSLYRDQHSPIFFSATLSPMPYYRETLCGRSSMDEPLALQLPSPYPNENLLLLEYDALETTYAKRMYTLDQVVAIIQTATSARLGNYLIFFPSHTYLQEVVRRYPRSASLDAPQLVIQTPNMKPSEQNAFLSAFEQPAQNRSTLGFAVLGGSFGEGIDLMGERLNGVIIIGVGLPQKGPERELLSQYYEEQLHAGFAFSYLYPGFTKILQAAGRLIRSETDRGFILLCDSRYATPTYRLLFPEHWHPHSVHQPEELLQKISQFWQSANPLAPSDCSAADLRF